MKGRDPGRNFFFFSNKFIDLSMMKRMRLYRGENGNIVQEWLSAKHKLYIIKTKSKAIRGHWLSQASSGAKTNSWATLCPDL